MKINGLNLAGNGNTVETARMFGASFFFFLSILNHSIVEFHLVKNRQENCHHDHIPCNLKENGNIAFWFREADFSIAFNYTKCEFGFPIDLCIEKFPSDFPFDF